MHSENALFWIMNIFHDIQNKASIMKTSLSKSFYSEKDMNSQFLSLNNCRLDISKYSIYNILVNIFLLWQII